MFYLCTFNNSIYCFVNAIVFVATFPISGAVFTISFFILQNSKFFWYFWHFNHFLQYSITPRHINASIALVANPLIVCPLTYILIKFFLTPITFWYFNHHTIKPTIQVTDRAIHIGICEYVFVLILNTTQPTFAMSHTTNPNLYCRELSIEPITVIVDRMYPIFVVVFIFNLVMIYNVLKVYIFYGIATIVSTQIFANIPIPTKNIIIVTTMNTINTLYDIHTPSGLYYLIRFVFLNDLYEHMNGFFCFK